MIRTYLEWLVELPWNTATTDNLELAHAREVLDADHYDLEKVKDRILEYLAVRVAEPGLTRPDPCFVGPPGVGKTSLGRSIARALGREFERISVGGVRDEAEIRGHRRTYIGAMPGTIIRALRDAGLAQPRVHDRRDRQDGRGLPRRPRRARCSRCSTRRRTRLFRDHYLDLPFDLSEVVFIATANTLDTIPPPLRDRMEVIQLSGYTTDEKLHIGQPLPRAQADRRERAEAGADLVRRPRRCGRSSRSTRARRACATSSARSAPSAARSPGEIAEGKLKRKATMSAKRARELLGVAATSPNSAAAPRTRASPPASPGPRLAARSCSSRRRRCRAPGS